MLFAVRRSEVHAANAGIVARSESSQITVDRGVVATVSRRDGKALGSGRALFLSDVDLISNASLTAGNTMQQQRPVSRESARVRRIGRCAATAAGGVRAGSGARSCVAAAACVNTLRSRMARAATGLSGA